MSESIKSHNLLNFSFHCHVQNTVPDRGYIAVFLKVLTT